MRITIALPVLLFLSACTPQATKFEKSYDWEDRSVRIAVLPTDNKTFDQHLVETFIKLGYPHTFIPAAPPYGENVYPNFATADLVVDTSRDIYTRESVPMIKKATLSIRQTRSPNRSGSVSRHGESLYESRYAGEASYDAEGVDAVIQILMYPLARYLSKE